MTGFRKRIFLFVCLSLLLVCHAAYSDAPETSTRPTKLILAVSQVKDSPVSIAYDLMYAEISRRLGIPIELKYLPGKRSSLYSDKGVVDGEASRVSVYHKAHPNMVIVREPIAEVVFSAFAVKPSIRLNGWESLSHTDLRVEYIRGTLLPEQMLSGIVKKENLSVVGNRRQGLKKLVAGRTDVFIEPAILIRALLQLPEFKASGIYKAGDMQRVTIHAFLFNRHKALEPELSAAIKAVREEGLIKKFIQTALGL